MQVSNRLSNIATVCLKSIKMVNHNLTQGRIKRQSINLEILKFTIWNINTKSHQYTHTSKIYSYVRLLSCM